MAKLNKFDRAIRKQVESLEAEPSARVWVGIREEIGTGRSEGMVWLYRSAAAILFLALVGASIWWYYGQDTLPSAPQMAEELQEAGPAKMLPPPEKVDFAPVLAEEDAQEEQEKDSKVVSQPAPSPRVIPMVEQEMPLEEPNAVDESPLEIAPEIEQAEEAIAQEPVEEVPSVEEPAEEEIKAPVTVEDDQKEVLDIEEQPESAETHRKQINFNNLRKNFSKDQLKEASGSVLGTVANGAKKAIGLDTEFEKTTTENYENKEFTARLGPIKFKRSRKVKK